MHVEAGGTSGAGASNEYCMQDLVKTLSRPFHTNCKGLSLQRLADDEAFVVLKSLPHRHQHHPIVDYIYTYTYNFIIHTEAGLRPCLPRCCAALLATGAAP